MTGSQGTEKEDEGLMNKDWYRAHLEGRPGTQNFKAFIYQGV